MQTEIDLLFGDGSYLFRLGLRQIVAVEDKCGPIGEVFARLLKGRYVGSDSGFGIGLPSEGAFKVHDVHEVIRQGLIGGASGEVDGEPVVVTPVTANRLVATYVEGRPLREAWDIATAIMSACIEGYTPPEAAPVVDDKKKAPRKRSTGAKSSPTVT